MGQYSFDSVLVLFMFYVCSAYHMLYKNPKRTNEALENESGVDSNVHIILSDATGEVVFDKMYDN